MSAGIHQHATCMHVAIINILFMYKTLRLLLVNVMMFVSNLALILQTEGSSVATDHEGSSVVDTQDSDKQVSHLCSLHHMHFLLDQEQNHDWGHTYIHNI